MFCFLDGEMSWCGDVNFLPDSTMVSGVGYVGSSTARWDTKSCSWSVLVALVDDGGFASNGGGSRF